MYRVECRPGALTGRDRWTESRAGWCHPACKTPPSPRRLFRAFRVSRGGPGRSIPPFPIRVHPRPSVVGRLRSPDEGVGSPKPPGCRPGHRPGGISDRKARRVGSPGLQNYRTPPSSRRLFRAFRVFRGGFGVCGSKRIGFDVGPVPSPGGIGGPKAAPGGVTRPAKRPPPPGCPFVPFACLVVVPVVWTNKTPAGNPAGALFTLSRG